MISIFEVEWCGGSVFRSFYSKFFYFIFEIVVFLWYIATISSETAKNKKASKFFKQLFFFESLPMLLAQN